MGDLRLFSLDVRIYVDFVSEKADIGITDGGHTASRKSGTDPMTTTDIATNVRDEIDTISSEIASLIPKAETGEQWAHICLLEDRRRFLSLCESAMRTELSSQ